MHDLVKHMKPIATRFWGEPNPQLSTPREMRFGSRGSRVVNLDSGIWYDHENAEGGGVLDLIARETGQANGAAVEWLKAEGFDVGTGVQTSADPRIVAEYDYRDEAGELLFQVVRREPKDFRQRAPDGAGGWRWSTKGVRRVLYRLPALVVAPDGATVFLVEGEKDVDRLASLGLLSTTCPGGANKWRPEYAEPLKRFRVVILPDNDPAGAEHADKIAAALRPVCKAVAVLALDGLPLKGDVSDWLDAGNTVEQLGVLAEAALTEAPAGGPAVVSAADLQRRVFPPICWTVPGLVPEGLTLLCGKPKLGKSWFAIDIGLAVSRGAFTLGRQCDPGAVLYLALEDSERRLKSRMELVAGSSPWPADFDFSTQWPRLDQGGLDHIESWLDRHANARLVIIDTLATVRPPARTADTAHGSDYAALRGLHAIANTRSVAIVVVHHVRKADADDPFDTVSGSTGLTGAADTTLILSQRAGDDGIVLYGRSRDLAEVETAVELDAETCRWRDLGDPAEAFASETRAAIFSAIRAGKTTPKTITDFTEIDGATIRQTLGRMIRAGDLRKSGRGRYELKGEPLTPRHNGHNVTKGADPAKNEGFPGNADCDTRGPDVTTSHNAKSYDTTPESGHCDIVTDVTGVEGGEL